MAENYFEITRAAALFASDLRHV